MNDNLTHKQAYAAMFDFIEQIFRRTNSDDLAALLGSMSTTADGVPADRRQTDFERIWWL